jgi:serine O-acetyltransferase
MIRQFRRTRLIISVPRLIPHIVVLMCTDRTSIIRADLIRWAEVLDLEIPRSTAEFTLLMLELMTFMPEYRNVLYLRLGIKSRLISWLCPSVSTLQITPTQIGPGLFIQHGLATVVAARKIGANCSISQNVTVGFSNRTDSPTIGDNVSILAGAKVIGNVTIGDNVVVGANTVVIGDVPANVTVFGVPGRVLWASKRGGPGQDG